jgi:hypothetical protein
MRAYLLLPLLFAACTPDIASGTYLCGPNAACPEGQVCNGPDNTCVFGSAEPFACEPDAETEPDDTAEQGRMLTALNECVTTVLPLANCMLAGDTADWVRFTVPSVCTEVQVEARVTFPLAFESLGLELWDLDQNTMVGSDTECASTGEGGEDIRCMTIGVTPGGNYGISVKPSGEGNCGGACAYNRYTLRVQLSTPG